jgi:hypothetical protein
MVMLSFTGGAYFADDSSGIGVTSNNVAADTGTTPDEKMLAVATKENTWNNTCDIWLLYDFMMMVMIEVFLFLFAG